MIFNAPIKFLSRHLSLTKLKAIFHKPQAERQVLKPRYKQVYLKKFCIPFYLILTSIMLLLSEVALAAPEITKFKLVNCVSSYKLKVGRVCTIEMSGRLQYFKKGTNITAYTSRGYWKSIGYLYAQKGSRMVVIFNNLSSGLAKNSKFKIFREYERFDWASSFSKSDF